MLNAAGYKKAVTGAHFKGSAGMLKPDAAADDMPHLFVRVTVAGANPAPFFIVCRTSIIAGL